MAATISPGPSFYEAARLILQALGIPQTSVNTRILVAWSWGEKPHPDGALQWYNPLNVTRAVPGSTPVPGNSAGVQVYPSLEVGIQANADTIRQYPTLLTALRRSDANLFFGPAGAKALIVWCGSTLLSCQGYADYLRQIYQDLGGTVAVRGGTVSRTTSAPTAQPSRPLATSTPMAAVGPPTLQGVAVALGILLAGYVAYTFIRSLTEAT